MSKNLPHFNISLGNFKNEQVNVIQLFKTVNGELIENIRKHIQNEIMDQINYLNSKY